MEVLLIAESNAPTNSQSSGAGETEHVDMNLRISAEIARKSLGVRFS
jgi:hypothetical protein